MKDHPLIRELQLGKSADELAQEILDHLADEGWNFQRIEEEQFTEALRSIAALNDPRARFAVWVDGHDCHIDLVNNDATIKIDGYYDEEYRFYLEDDAACDCELLNHVVQMVFGPHKFKKVTKKEIAEGETCPHCGDKNYVALDRFEIDSLAETRGCTHCGGTWNLFYERKLKKVSKN
jgi:hypothetical protein